MNQERLWTRMMGLSKIGEEESGGVTRLSFSREERQAKDLVASWMTEAGLVVREDAIGNLIGRREGTEAGSPVVLVGSHVDSVFEGGNFDGPLGVLSAIEALQSMQEEGVLTAHPIEVIAFTDEEGARFRFGMIGSRGVAGTLQPAQLEAKDRNGVSIAEAMREAGFVPEQIATAARAKGSVKGYVELHIEQGKVLENAGLSVGVVSGIAGPLWLKFRLTGESGHAGTTPMGLRHDPLVGAAQLMLAIEEEARHHSHTVGTVGQMALKPGGVNIIPGEVEFTLDLRDVDEGVRDEVERRLRESAEQLGAQRGLQIDIEVLQRVAPAVCDAKIQSTIRAACETLGLETLSLASGAGHDGMQLAPLCPVGMVFVRSKNGISHNPEEWSSPEDCWDGARVLHQTLLLLADAKLPE